MVRVAGWYFVLIGNSCAYHSTQNPWELPRIDVNYEVRFYGTAERLEDGRAVWQGGQEVLAVAYDVMVPGCYTKNTNNLRLWESKPKRGFDLMSFNGGYTVFTPLSCI
jgi:starch phosphorylase